MHKWKIKQKLFLLVKKTENEQDMHILCKHSTLKLIWKHLIFVSLCAVTPSKYRERKNTVCECWKNVDRLITFDVAGDALEVGKA